MWSHIYRRRTFSKFLYRAGLTAVIMFLLTVAPSPLRAVDAEGERVTVGDQRLAIAMSPLPSLAGNVEGAFVGTVGNVVVVAGGVRAGDGTRLPDASDYLGRVLYLPVEVKESRSPDVPDSVTAGPWEQATIDLPFAFGAVAVSGNSMYCVGGMGSYGLSAQVTKITVTGDVEKGLVVQAERLPDLVVPTAFGGAVVMNGQLHLVGGITSLKPLDANARHLALSLDPKQESDRGWKDLGDVPGVANVVAPCVGVRRDDIADADALFLAGGWMYDGVSEQLLPMGRAWKWLQKNPKEGTWTDLAPPPSGAAFRGAMPLGPAHWLLFGRLDAGALTNVAALCAVPRGKTGFFNYHTFTDTWVKLPWTQELGGVALAGRGKGFVMIATSAVGEPSTAVSWCAFLYNARHFTWLDYTVLTVYMVALLVIGFWCSRKEHDTSEFFLGSRNIPWWAAGLSMYATGISAISFMAIPAKTYATNWLRFGEPIMGFFAMLVAGFVFVPLLRRLELTTMMEFLELRFNKAIRFLSSFLAIIGQVTGRMGVVLLLPSYALQAVTGLDVRLCILFMGAVATLYTVLGGIRAVIWTDVLQFVVLFGGAILCFVMITFQVDGGLGGMLETGRHYGKLHTFDFTPDLRSLTIWVMVLWGIGDVMSRLGQDNMQRAFSTKGSGEARKAMVTCAAVSLPGAMLFFILGTGLFVFYKARPELLNPTLDNDSILPLFVAQQLPAGISGLIIAGLFAAAQSTLDSTMNGVATIVTRDWYSVFHVNAQESTRLKTARVITVVCGVLGTITALYMASLGMRSLWDGFAKIMALIGGAFAGVMALALLTRRANWLGALLGAMMNIPLIALILMKELHLHFMAWGIMFLTVGFAFGYLFSLMLDMSLSEEQRVRWNLKKDLTGLTVWTPRQGAD